MPASRGVSGRSSMSHNMVAHVVGPRSKGVDFVNWYLSKLHKAAHRDPVAALAFLRVANLLAPPPSVMHPKIALRVLMAHLRG